MTVFAKGWTPKLTNGTGVWEVCWGLGLHIKHMDGKKADNEEPNLGKFVFLYCIVLPIGLTTRRSGAYPSPHCRPLRRA